ncbi:MAG: hypothetical protein E6929_19260 [Clostridium sp.]|nr:hypothetical protein [Clostridium sp.]
MYEFKLYLPITIMFFSLVYFMYFGLEITIGNIKLDRYTFKEKFKRLTIEILKGVFYIISLNLMFIGILEIRKSDINFANNLLKVLVILGVVVYFFKKLWINKKIQ